MINYSPQEIQIIEKYRGGTSKGVLASLYAIYDAYNGTNNTNCWCSRLYREQKADEFYAWYDANKTSENDNQAAN